MLQQKVPTSSGQALWCSPERDIAHVLPLYISKALKVAEEDAKNRTDLDMAVMLQIASSLIQFVKSCTGERVATLQGAFDKAGLMELYKTKEGDVFVRAFFRTVLSAFYEGVLQSVHPNSGETFANIDKLQVAVEEANARRT